jgi:G3E family GTPase
MRPLTSTNSTSLISFSKEIKVRLKVEIVENELGDISMDAFENCLFRQVSSASATQTLGHLDMGCVVYIDERKL